MIKDLINIFRHAGDETVLMVLGMHRSGTSCLTGILQEAGLELGDVVTEARHNKKGNRESLAIRKLNDELLSYNNGSWDSPPDRIKWERRHSREANRIAREFSDCRLWGFKDPRCVITLPFWKKILGGRRLHYIGTFRQPIRVAQSLKARQQSLDLVAGLELWKNYNSRIAHMLDSDSFPIVDFDSEPATYIRKVREALRRLDISELGAEDGFAFFDKGLIHQGAGFPVEDAIPEEIFAQVEEIHRILKSYA
jgi:hypothetical protein